MRKFLQSTISALLAFILFSSQALAYTGTNYALNNTNIENSVADFDETEIYSAFDEIDELLGLLNEQSDITYANIESENSDLILNVSATSAIALTSSSADGPPIFNAFLWGCLFNWVGMLVVGLSTDFDGYHLRKSGWGCLISSILWGTGGCFYYF